MALVLLGLGAADAVIFSNFNLLQCHGRTSQGLSAAYRFCKIQFFIILFNGQMMSTLLEILTTIS